MKVLLSIKPVFVKEIMEGRKLFGYRKTIYKNRNMSKIIAYPSRPVYRIVGEFIVRDILCESPKTLWEETGGKSGVSKGYFKEYFGGGTTDYAI